MKFLKLLLKRIKFRIRNSESKSYITYLKKNKEKMRRKILEEAYEFIIELRKNNSKRIVSEFCDLIFHSFVAVFSKKISIKIIEKEIFKRMS
ncbi:phosphoribosyl-ATP diphosphatase [Candidatus Vidania fulgoroideorum]